MFPSHQMYFHRTGEYVDRCQLDNDPFWDQRTIQSQTCPESGLRAGLVQETHCNG